MLSSKAAPETGAAACSAPRSLLPAPPHPSLCWDRFGPRLQTPRLSVSHDASSLGDHHLHKVIKSFLNSSTLPWTIYIIHPSKGFCAVCILIFQTNKSPPASVFGCDAQSVILPSCASLLFYHLTFSCSFMGTFEKSTGMILLVTLLCAIFKGFLPLDIKFELYFGPIAHVHPGICWGRDPSPSPHGAVGASGISSA